MRTENNIRGVLSAYERRLVKKMHGNKLHRKTATQSSEDILLGTKKSVFRWHTTPWLTPSNHSATARAKFIAPFDRIIYINYTMPSLAVNRLRSLINSSVKCAGLLTAISTVALSTACTQYPTAYSAGSQQLNDSGHGHYQQDAYLVANLVNTSTTDRDLYTSASQQGVDIESHFSKLSDGTSSTLQTNEQAYLNSRSVEKLQSSAPSSDLWGRISSKMTLVNTVHHQAIDDQVEFYRARPLHLKRLAERSQRYLYHITNEVDQRRLPMELVMLPAIESAYDPFAYSSGRASGLWQFVPNTAKHVGLKSSWWYDGRRDILASTDSALGYLIELNRRFDGDWLLTLAAYNSGAGTVNRAIRKNRKAGKPTDYWSLDLPKETKTYVPRLLAISKLIKRAKSYDIRLPELANSPYFDVVETHGQLDLAHAAELADVSIDEIYRLNPGFNRWATDPVGPHRMLVPRSQREVFKEALANIPKSERMAWQRYKVQSGDSLILLAKRFGTDVSTLKAANKLDHNMIKIGAKILVPTKSISRKSYVTNSENRLAAAAHNISQKQGNRLFHVVKKGDSLWSIATKYDVRSKDIASWNSMKKKDVIRPGQTLTVWVKPEQRSASKNSGIIRKVGYTVRSGDSLSRIANRFKVKVADIGKWNGNSSNKYLKPGQHLTLYVDVTK